MKRSEEIREKMREVREGNRYNFRAWLKAFVIPAKKPGWRWILVSGGDVRGQMHLDHSPLTRRRCSVVEIDGVPHTVIEVRDRFLPVLERAKSLRTFFSLFTTQVLHGDDVKRFHYDLWLAAHNLEAKVKRLGELQRRDIRKPTEVEQEVFSHNSIRAAAMHNRNF